MNEPVSNPFATRFVRPGAIRYRFAPGGSADELVRRLRSLDWRGEIVGPHGSGKSTLVAALVPALKAAGRRVLLFTLGEGARRLPEPTRLSVAGADTQVIVDGYEQLSAWSRWRLRALCRSRRAGLLVTTHRASGLPLLIRTQVDAATAVEIVRELVSGSGRVEPAEVLPALDASGGDMREALFALYDLFEQRRPCESRPN